MPEKTPKIGRLTLEELRALKDEDIDTSDIPELDDEFWFNAKIAEGLASGPATPMESVEELLTRFREAKALKDKS